EQQVAGDILYPDDPGGIAALGFLAAGPWDESSQQSIRDDTLDKKQAQVLDRDDMVTTVLSAFASTTVHCARCHDHKFDPVRQEEYYGLQAVFAGVDRANRPYDPDQAVHQRRPALAQRHKQLRSAPLALLLGPASDRAVSAWEAKQKTEAWETLEVESVTVAHGSTSAKLPDRSVRFGGLRPEREVYTLTATTKRSNVTAVRLEVLTDDS